VKSITNLDPEVTELIYDCITIIEPNNILIDPLSKLIVKFNLNEVEIEKYKDKLNTNKTKTVKKELSDLWYKHNNL